MVDKKTTQFNSVSIKPAEISISEQDIKKGTETIKSYGFKINNILQLLIQMSYVTKGSEPVKAYNEMFKIYENTIAPLYLIFNAFAIEPEIYGKIIEDLTLQNEEKVYTYKDHGLIKNSFSSVSLAEKVFELLNAKADAVVLLKK